MWLSFEKQRFVTGQDISGSKNLKNLKILSLCVFKDSKDQILNNLIVKV